MGKRTFVLMILLIAGCAGRLPHTLVSDYAKRAPRLIAVMPVENKTKDQRAAAMVREKMLDELYFKGYPKVPLVFVDAALVMAGAAGGIGATDGRDPQALGKAMKVDAVLQCTVDSMDTSITFFYASLSLSVSCELRGSSTGEVFWKAHYQTVERNFGYSRRDLELKRVHTYESTIQGGVNKILETLPDGPDLLG
jgi:hypothetical protein